MKNNEENIINIRINSDDLLMMVGWLGMMAEGIQIPKEITREIIMEVIERITTLNISNKEFLETIKNESSK